MSFEHGEPDSRTEPGCFIDAWDSKLNRRRAIIENDRPRFHCLNVRTGEDMEGGRQALSEASKRLAISAPRGFGALVFDGRDWLLLRVVESDDHITS